MRKELDLPGLKQGQMSGCCEHVNEHLEFIRGGEQTQLYILFFLMNRPSPLKFSVMDSILIDTYFKTCS